VTRESLTPNVTFEDVVGQEEAKRVLEAAIIKPLLEGVAPSNVLLSGVTGTGKDFLALAVAGEVRKRGLPVNCYVLDPGEIYSGGLSASSLQEPAIVIAKDVDAYARSDPVHVAHLAFFKRFLDECSGRRIAVIATTSNPAVLAEEVRARFIEAFMCLPSEGEALQILRGKLGSHVAEGELSKVTGELRMLTQRELSKVADLALGLALSAGRQRVVADDILQASRLVDPIIYKFQEKGWYTPPGDLKNVLGLEELVVPDQVKEEVKQCLGMLRNPDRYQGSRRSQAILLYGPPGVGKTSLAYAVAKELGSGLLRVDSRLLSEYLGAAERNLYTIFQLAKTFAPIVVLIDELPVLFGRARQGDVYASLRGVLLLELDRLGEGVLVVATANRLEDIDEALLRRFKALKIPQPATPEEVFRVLLVHLKRRGLCREDEGTLKYIKEQIVPGLMGRSPAEVSDIVEEASRLALSEGSRCIDTFHVERVLDRRGGVV